MAKRPADFETAIAEVKAIVGRLESGEISLAESLQQYETGVGKLKICSEILAAAELRVSVLSGFDADGNPITEPMPEMEQAVGSVRRATSGSTGSKPATKSVAKSAAKPKPASDLDDAAGLF